MSSSGSPTPSYWRECGYCSAAARPVTSLELALGDLRLNLLQRRVYRGDVELELSRREFELLEYLVRDRGQTVSREMLARDSWRDPQTLATNVIDVFINRLRPKLDRRVPLQFCDQCAVFVRQGTVGTDRHRHGRQPVARALSVMGEHAAQPRRIDQPQSRQVAHCRTVDSQASFRMVQRLL